LRMPVVPRQHSPLGVNSSIREIGEARMLQGFKQFIFRGNVLDLAGAVVMGVAFGAVVAALVQAIRI
jgi:large-conductance mechanosensitive channel MscL